MKIPFDYYVYIGTVHLNRQEHEVWRMTPRKILSLWNRHAIFNKWKKEETKFSKAEKVYADQVPW